MLYAPVSAAFMPIVNERISVQQKGDTYFGRLKVQSDQLCVPPLQLWLGKKKHVYSSFGVHYTEGINILAIFRIYLCRVRNG
jgi:hypothetical protein